MPNAAIYLRSSKDRHDVSISRQRRDLEKLAIAKDFTIVREYVDVVESAKTEFRPAFQDLIRDFKIAERGWDTLLVLDTSRLSRRRYVAQVFKHDAEKHGIKIMYAMMPDVDPMTNVILESIMEAMDEYHSLMSRQKGLAGMAENVRQGFRAGGKAPRGYDLEYFETGAIRDGKAVRKSKLRPNDDAHLIARYLKRRANGESRSVAKRALGLDINPTSLIGMEWNALTYAGHTVWNVHAERIGGAYKGGKKRRPRSEWHIKRDTHEALIPDEQAEAILHALENSTIGQAISKARAQGSPYLLTPYLEAPDGRTWQGMSRKYYRLPPTNGKKGRTVPLKPLEDAVLGQVMADARSPKFVKALVREARKIARRDYPARPLYREVVELNKKIARAAELALQMETTGPMMRLSEDLERRRQSILAEIAEIQKDSAARQAMANITEDQVAGILAEAVDEKAVLTSMVTRIELDPVSGDCQVQYSLPDCVSMASPRGFEPLLPP